MEASRLWISPRLRTQSLFPSLPSPLARLLQPRPCLRRRLSLLDQLLPPLESSPLCLSPPLKKRLPFLNPQRRRSTPSSPAAQPWASRSVFLASPSRSLSALPFPSSLEMLPRASRASPRSLQMFRRLLPAPLRLPRPLPSSLCLRTSTPTWSVSRFPPRSRNSSLLPATSLRPRWSLKPSTSLRVLRRAPPRSPATPLRSSLLHRMPSSVPRSHRHSSPLPLLVRAPPSRPLPLPFPASPPAPGHPPARRSQARA
ncbi:hypothetical protein F5X68DRAFT_31040 [Plectosphaerella plurivora]|uniref:Uncharacterized protein n=1 Tax=Plectosphaerella plurivora TaxID=936078 RepID=A0A9P9AEZ1_9PEZI|nr:hypothetical protein F5X68DRAFT_31040 [Plectosphaerella plurivora]